ncbi:MAG: class I tRNA ligase family protein [Verrucomicrobia bacterium]|nr:class I tRNA ligase family protein [Verrucomicrobiota bacterium]
MTSKNFAQGLPAAVVAEAPETEVHDLWQKTCNEVVDLYQGFQFHTGLERTFYFITALNRYAEIRAPWKLAKSTDEKDQALLATSLATLAEGLRVATILLAPVMPGITQRIQGLLGEPDVTEWGDNLSWGSRLNGRILGEKTILFPRPQPAAAN